MAEYPILLNTDAVRALHRGEKTQTRRLIKQQPLRNALRAIFSTERGRWLWQYPHSGISAGLHGRTVTDHYNPFRCPYGVPGGYLWTRERWAQIYKEEGCYWEETPRAYKCPCGHCDVEYFADTRASLPAGWPEEERDNPDRPKWRASIHMPRWASRDQLPVIDIQVERIQSITDEDAEKEGILCGLHKWDCLFSKNWGHTPFENCCRCGEHSPSEVYQRYWELIHPGSWERNDWVFKIEWSST